MYKQTVAALALLMATTNPLQCAKPSQQSLFNDAIHNSIAQLMHWGKLKSDALQTFISPSNINTVISLLRNCIALWEQHSKAAKHVQHPTHSPIKNTLNNKPKSQDHNQQAPKKASAPAKRPQPQASPAGIAPCAFPGQLLFLPGLTGGALRVPGAYHLYSLAEIPIKYRLSCNFHALYNVVKLERIFCQRYINDRTFLNACRAIAPNDLHSSSTTTQGATIAHELGLDNVYYLGFEDGRIRPFFDTDTWYTQKHGESKNAAIERAVSKRVDELWTSIRSQCLKKRSPCCFHFVCHIKSRSIRHPGKGEKHFFLTSVVKMADGKIALYIADNVNADENHESQAEMRAYVEHVYHQLFRVQA
jgi:hypothetical protein